MYEEEKIAMRVIGCGLLILALIAAVIAYDAIPTEAKGRTGKYTAGDGNIYIVRNGKVKTGLFRYKGSYYYGHKTSSMYYPKGSVTRNDYRYIRGKLYYFGRTGKMLTKDTYYLDVRSRDRSIRSIKYPGTGGKERYNVSKARLEIKKRGRWREVGMQYTWVSDMQP